MNTNKGQLVNPTAVNILRICAALSVFLCHACNESGTSIGNALGQLFNVGVPIFFILSGYLYSTKQMPTSISSWYLRRADRILLPLHIFLIGLLCVHLVIGVPVSANTWINNFIPLCGLTQDYISGCGHLWYITDICICYLIAPIFFLPIKNRDGKYLWALPIIYLFSLIGLAYLIPPIWCTLFVSLASYCIGFFYLPIILKKGIFHKASLGLAVLAVVLRLATRHLFDGTPLYTSVFAAVTHQLLAISLIIIFFDISKILNHIVELHPKLDKVLAVSGGITYEFYIIHQIFLTGALKLSHFPSFLLNVLVSFALSVILALFLYQLTSLILRKRTTK